MADTLKNQKSISVTNAGPGTWVAAVFWAVSSAAAAVASGHAGLQLGHESIHSIDQFLLVLKTYPLTAAVTVYWAGLAIGSLFAIGRLAGGQKGTWGASFFLTLVAVGVLVERVSNQAELGVLDSDRAAVLMIFAGFLFAGSMRFWWLVLAPLLALTAILPFAWLEFWKAASTPELIRAAWPIGLSLVISGLAVVVRDARKHMAQTHGDLMELLEREAKVKVDVTRLKVTPKAEESFEDSYEETVMTTVEVASPRVYQETATTTYQDLQSFASEALELARAKWISKPGIRLLLTAPEDLGLPIAVRAQPEEVRIWILSLVESAIEALGGGQGTVRVTLKPSLAFVSVSVEDNGRGLSLGVAMNRGQEATGALSLVEIRTQLERSGGRFDVQSRLGVGTRVNLELSRVDALTAMNRGGRKSALRDSTLHDSNSRHG